MQPTLPSITEVAQAGMFGLKLPALPHNPFVGLRPFNIDEALLFFGRHEQTIELLQQLHRTHFVAIIGSSGCGKSSLVRAGLIPKLKAGFLVEDRDQWLVATMKPGDAPMRNLDEALVNATSIGVAPLIGGAPSGGSARNQDFPPEGGTPNERTLNDRTPNNRAPNDAIIERLDHALDESDANLLLLVDQFEELFRYGVDSGQAESRAEATQFVKLMLALSEQRRAPIYVVMTMRSDFLGDCDNFYGLPEAMNRSQYLVPRLTREQLRQAVEGPVNLFGASLTPDLIDRVLNDVGEKSDQLPVMQHALMRTWELRKFEGARKGDQQVDLQHYESVGGINDALSKDAEAALNGMDADQLKITERMFQALTDTDARSRCVRRPVNLSVIEAVIGADRKKILEIIKRFQRGGRSFLTMTDDGDPLLDISHESLIRQWDRMSAWVNSEAESRDLYLRLVDSVKKGRELWRGSDLAEALRWREQKQPNIAWARRYEKDEGEAAFGLAFDFLERSKIQEEVEAVEREKERKNKLRKIRGIALILAIAFLLAALSALYARNQTAIANEQKKIAEEAKRTLFTLLVTNIANQSEVLYYNYAAYRGVWIHRDGSFENLGGTKPTDEEWQMLTRLQILTISTNTLRQLTQNTTPQRNDIIRIQESVRDIQQTMERVSMTDDLKRQAKLLLADIQSFVDLGLRLL